MNRLIIFSYLSMGIFLISCSAHKHSHVVQNKHTGSFMGDYELTDVNHGTKTTVNVVGDQRVMETNALPNHETGAFPNPGNPNTITAQNQKYTFPLKPEYTGEARRVKETGVALNGVKFDPGTAERVECGSGEVFNMEAIQDFTDLGLDFNNAHVQPTGAYHYHGVSTKLADKFDEGDDLVHIGFAKDGFRIMYSKSGMYKSGYKLKDEPRQGTDCTYDTRRASNVIEMQGTKPDGRYTSDWEFNESAGNLDQCNGTRVDGEYIYLITVEYPFVGRCLMGEFKEERRGPGRGRRGQGPPPKNRG